MCINYILKHIPEAKISSSMTNQFEYPGIHKVWELSKEDPSKDHYILYFHSKGMSCLIAERDRWEHVLFQENVRKWNKAVDAFNDEKVNKVGGTPNEKGIIWYNFWWARASYLIQLEEPIVNIDRYYYKHWLSKTNVEDCYSLLAEKRGVWYTPVTAGDAYESITCVD